MNISEYKKQLLKSTMFNLSLGSKELFHSNFLAYLISNDSTILNFLFADIMEIKWEGKILVEREKDNFDLLIHDKNNCLIIENKVKSIPNIKQLAEYQEKAKSKYKKEEIKLILITVYEPDNLNKYDIGDWNILNYEGLLNGLRKYLANVSNSYLREVICDYISFMDVFINLFKSLKIVKEQSIYVEQKVLNDLKELRIHDLFYKSRFDELKSDLQKSVHNKYGDIYKLTESKEWQELDLDEISVTKGFSRGTGLFELKIPIFFTRNKHRYIIGVQLQDHSFKILLQSTDKDKIEKVAHKLSEDRVWFDFSMLNEKCTTYDKQKKEFCSYNSKEGLMKYKYKVIDDVTNVKIIEIFMEYLTYIMCNKDKLTNVLSSFYI